MTFDVPKYRPKNPCQRCGTSLRYTKGNNCVHCVINGDARRKSEARLKYSMEDWKQKMRGVQYENIETGN